MLGSMEYRLYERSLETPMPSRRQEQLRVGLPSVRSRLHPKVMSALSLPPRMDSNQLVFSSGEAAVFFLRPWDLPPLVTSGWLDAAFCGSDVVNELQADVEISHEFGEHRAPLALCKRTDVDLANASPLVVATEYTRIAEEHLRKRGTDYRILRVHGACEAYPHLDGVSAIVDIVETGATLRANGLEIVDVAAFTSPCLIQSRRTEPSRRLRVMDWRDLVAEALA